MAPQPGGRGVEFLLTVGCLVLLFIVLKKTGNTATELQALQRSLKDISGRLDQMLRAGPAPSASPAQPAETKLEIIRMPVPETPPPAPEPLPPPPSPEPARSAVPVVPPTPEPEPISVAAAVSAEEAPPPPSRPSHGGPDFGDFEKRFGTQWVVWVGGIALALGGIFLVRYSIEAGLFGPGLRVFFGALLAAALVGLGELARRREIISGLDKLPTKAHIPSILTAAGTTSTLR